MSKYYLFLDESGHHGLKTNIILGTQLCDLVAYPIATRILYPERENIAFKTIEPKFYRQFPDGDYLGYGLKIFP